MKKWIKLHKKQIFAILCVLMLSLSCVPIVSATEPDQYYPYYDFSISGIDYSGLPGSFVVVPSYYDEYAEYTREFTYDDVDTIEINVSTTFSSGYFEFAVINESQTGQPNGVSSLSFYDFYLSNSYESDVNVIECSFNLSNGSIADDVIADIYYSNLGSDYIIHESLQLDNTDAISYLTIDDFPEYLNGVYVHSLTLSTDSTAADFSNFSLEYIYCTVYTGWIGRSADLERAESNNGGSVLSSLSGVFSSVTQWIINSLVTVVSLFFVDGKFTIFGILAIISVAISIVLFLISIVIGFVRFRC